MDNQIQDIAGRKREIKINDINAVSFKIEMCHTVLVESGWTSISRQETFLYCKAVTITDQADANPHPILEPYQNSRKVVSMFCNPRLAESEEMDNNELHFLPFKQMIRLQRSRYFGANNDNVLKNGCAVCWKLCKL